MLVKFGFAQMEVVQKQECRGDCRLGRVGVDEEGVRKTTKNNGTRQSITRKGGDLQFKKKLPL